MIPTRSNVPQGIKSMEKIDIAYLFYWITFLLLIYNGVCFVVWAFVSKSYHDDRYRMPCFNVLALIICFAYVLALNIYARGLRTTAHVNYHDFLNSQSWAIRYLPIVIMLLFISFRLTLWITDTVRIYCAKRRSAEWKKRKFESKK